MTRSALTFLALVAVAACGQESAPTPPSGSADPPPIDGETAMPGLAADNFIGRWAAQADGCANVEGPERPIEITTRTFEGYENRCTIQQVGQVSTAYEAVLACVGEGVTTQERVRMRVIEDRLTLNWLDRAGSSSTTFRRCPAAQPAPAAPEPTG